MNSLIPWCPIKARNGSYEVVTREGNPVLEWYEFKYAIDNYPLFAVVQRKVLVEVPENERDDKAVEYRTVNEIEGFSREGRYVAHGEIVEDERDLMLKLITENVNGFLVRKGVDNKHRRPIVFIADPMSLSWYRELAWEAALDGTKECWIERGLVYYTADHAAEKAKAMAGIDPRTTNRGEA